MCATLRENTIKVWEKKTLTKSSDFYIYYKKNYLLIILKNKHINDNKQLEIIVKKTLCGSLKVNKNKKSICKKNFK